MPRKLDKIEADYDKARLALADLKKELQTAKYADYIGTEYTTYGSTVFTSTEVREQDGVVYLVGTQVTPARVDVDELADKWWRVEK